MRLLAATDRFLGRTASWRLSAALIVGVVAVVSCLAVPLKITVDGILYLSSAKSLFNSHFSTDFAWFREPGYPVLLRIIHFFGNDGLYIILVQAVLLGLSIFIALYATRIMLGRGAPSVGALILVIVLALNPMFLIYSSLVLQQALFSFQLALFALGVVLALARPGWLRRRVLIALVALNYFLSIWTSIGWIYLALFPVALTMIAGFWPDLVRLFRRTANGAQRVAVVVMTIVAALILTSAVYAAGVTVYSGWEAVKAPYLKNLSIPGAVIEPLSGPPALPTSLQLVQRMGALMHMGIVEPYVSENDLFMRQQMVRGAAGGAYDTAFIKKPYTTFAAGWVAIPDSSNALHFAYALTAGRFAPVGYAGAFIGYLLALILTLVRRRWKLLLTLAVPLSFLAVYALSNSPIDRYGIPAFPWAVASTTLLVTWAREAFIALVARRNDRRVLLSAEKSP